MGEDRPQSRHAMLVHERRARLLLRAGVAVAVVLVGVAVYFGAVLSGTRSSSGSTAPVTPPAAPGASSTLPGLAAAMNGTLTGTPPPDTTTTEPTHSATPPLGSMPPQLAAAVSSCRTRWALESTVLGDADRALAQWRRHLEIMNELQAGRISLATAKA